jgi:hypothetical protein
MTFAVFGTLLSAIVTGALTFAFSHIPFIALPLSFRHALLFGALVCLASAVSILCPGGGVGGGAFYNQWERRNIHG